MGDDARERQHAEAESLEAIFGDDYNVSGTWKDDSSVDVAFVVTVDPTLALRFRLPADYPDVSRPEVEATWSGVGDPAIMRSSLSAYVETMPLGEEMVYSIAQWCQDRLVDGFGEAAPSCSGADVERTPAEPAPEQGDSCAPVRKRSQRGLPLANYFRAESLGEGGFGSVMHVYDDDGREWAAKQFESAEDGGIDTSTLREIGLLRALRNAPLHPNIIAIGDMASINGELCMIMASYKCSLRDAVAGGAMESTKGAQLRVARGLLSSVAFLHASGTMHRDIKPGNVMLTDELEPVLIDFSLAKVELKLESAVAESRAPRSAKEKRRKARGKTLVKQECEDAKHSQGVGTPLYMAPEVFNSEEYSAKADIWSSGIVLMEVFDPKFREQLDKCDKEKAAHALIAQTVTRLGSKPIPSLLKALLEADPAVRLQAQEAVDRLIVAVPKGALAGDLPEIAAAVICSVPESTPTLPDGVAQQIVVWTTFFRCSGRVRIYAGLYACRSAQACENPLHAVILAGRLHETDFMQAAPVYDFDELGDWAADEEDEELINQLECCLGQEDYFHSERQILRELDYQLY